MTTKRPEWPQRCKITVKSINKQLPRETKRHKMTAKMQNEGPHTQSDPKETKPIVLTAADSGLWPSAGGRLHVCCLAERHLELQTAAAYWNFHIRIFNVDHRSTEVTDASQRPWTRLRLVSVCEEEDNRKWASRFLLTRFSSWCLNVEIQPVKLQLSLHF